MYIIYNADGSIKKINLTDYVQQGNNNVNVIFLAIDGLTNEQWSGTIFCELPNGEIVGPITPTNATLSIGDETYNGYNWSLAADVTVLEGLLIFSLQARTLASQQVLFTYKGVIPINPSSAIPNETKITLAQYNALRDLVLQDHVDAATKQYVHEYVNAAIELALGTVENELEELDTGDGI